MRLCHVITKPELGGAQLSTLNILSRLPKDKYSVYLITSPNGILSAEFKRLNIKTIFSKYLTRGINPILDILAFIHILRIYISIKPHIIHTHSSKAGIIGRLAARLKGVPVIIHTVHGWPFNNYQSLVIKWIFILLERITARFTKRIICVSKADINTALRYKIAPEDKFEFIKYGISLSDFRKRPLEENRVASLLKRREFGINNVDPVVAMISCLKVQKSPLDYIRASIEIYNKLPNVNFLLIGDGVLKIECKRLLSYSALNGRFIFTGWRRDISEILDIVDIVVLTSKWEGMPIAIIEALCKGCPVVATKTGGIPELIRDGFNGYLTQPGSYIDIADRLLKILTDLDLFNRMKTAASLSIDDSFSLDRMVDKVEGLYNRLS